MGVTVNITMRLFTETYKSFDYWNIKHAIPQPDINTFTQIYPSGLFL